MSGTDPAFKSSGKKEGIEIWRIEKLKVVAIDDKSKFGKFYTGDSYIVLVTERLSSGWKWDIFFWLGKETTQDESGVAAYKTVELDDHLGGSPVQHREVQGHESQEFHSAFKPYGGVSYMAGGIASGFKKVEKENISRLLHVKGKRNVRVNEVEVSFKSLNKGDVFILDKGDVIYQWNGAKASRSEKMKAMEVTAKIKSDERGGKAQIVIIDDGKDKDDKFFQALGGSGPVKDAADDDAEYEKKKNAALKLYRVSDASGSIKVEEAGSSPLKKDMLDTNDSFILDTSQSLFVWIGKKATKEEKNSAWKIAMKFIQDKGYPAHTPVTRVIEGGETLLFMQQFASWPNPKASTNFSYGQKRGNVAKVAQTKVDVGSMHSQKEREKQVMVDDGTGKLELYRIEDFDKVAVDSKMYGQFYQGDSYVMLYTYKDKNGRENYIIYYWQGLDSTTDEKGASAAIATKMDDDLGGAPVQVRVVQNKEPDHFLALFKGKFIIHKGGRGSGFKNTEQKDEYDTDGTRFFHVKGTNKLNTKATQVEEQASSLNSNDCFVLESPKGTWLWYGKYASGDERDCAKSIAGALGKSSAETIFEEKEPEAFWAALGGKGDYPKQQRQDDSALNEPRLFQCSNATGKMSVEEIFDYAQEDLVSDDIMILDCQSEVYLWVGSGANADEKKQSLEIAIDYVKNSPDGRNPENTPILTIKQGFEPPLFKQYFIWDDEKAKAGISEEDYEKMKKQLESGAVTDAASELAKYSQTYDYDTLLKRPLPEGVDPTNLERHLNADEFSKVFGMEKEAFMALPGWKRTNLKKDKKLF